VVIYSTVDEAYAAKWWAWERGVVVAPETRRFLAIEHVAGYYLYGSGPPPNLVADGKGKGKAEGKSEAERGTFKGQDTGKGFGDGKGKGPGKGQDLGVDTESQGSGAGETSDMGTQSSVGGQSASAGPDGSNTQDDLVWNEAQGRWMTPPAPPPLTPEILETLRAMPGPPSPPPMKPPAAVLPTDEPSPERHESQPESHPDSWGSGNPCRALCAAMAKPCGSQWIQCISPDLTAGSFSGLLARELSCPDTPRSP
jgi:hypothetical protein